MDPNNNTQNNQNVTPLEGQISPQPQPPASGYPQPQVPMQQPNAIPQPGMSPTAMSQPPSSSKRKWLFIGVGLIVVVVIVVVFVAMFHKNNTNNAANSSGTGAQTSQLAGQNQLLAKYGSHLQASDISQFNKTNLFYTVLKNAAMQRVATVTTDRYEGSGPTDQSTRQLEFLRQATFDYQSKALAEETQDPFNTYNMRCVDGKNYTYDDVNTMSWQAETGSSLDCTDPNTYDNDINDGFNTGGLSESQAQKFVSAIANAKGLISVDSMSYVTHDNAPYIRLSVTVHPILISGFGYEGMGVLGGAFKETGLDELKWPYQTVGNIATGATFIYYVNPATQLPAYSQIGLTYSIDDSTGQQRANNVYDFQDTEYKFGGAVQPLSLTGAPTKLKLSWPEEKI